MIQDDLFEVLFNRFVVKEPFLEFFPRGEFNTYDAFVTATGECLKSEPRTHVVRLERRRPDTEKPERFVVKEYYYPWLPRIRTWLRHSKAEHEFRSLIEVAKLGLLAAEPVAFGTRRTLLGHVRSCFIITRYVENSLTLEQWTEEGRQLGMRQAELDRSICRALGQIFRTLHLAHFFLFTAKPRNILLRPTADYPEIIIIDLPYALHVTMPPLARWAQALDFAVLFGNLPRKWTERERADFYNAYLPDPLGGCVMNLDLRLARAIRWRRNQTPVSSLVHRVRRTSKKWACQQRKRAASLRPGLKSFSRFV